MFHVNQFKIDSRSVLQGGMLLLTLFLDRTDRLRGSIRWTPRVPPIGVETHVNQEDPLSIILQVRTIYLQLSWLSRSLAADVRDFYYCIGRCRAWCAANQKFSQGNGQIKV